LRELNYVEGQNVAIEYRWAEGRYDRFPALVAEAVQLKVDVIVAAGTPAVLAAKEGTRTIPIVMAASRARSPPTCLSSNPRSLNS